MSSRNDDRDGDLSDREIVSTRTFDAPRERVFGAFSEPSCLARWWGPKGFTSTIHELDMRPGGTWRFTMHGPDGADYPSESVFVEIVEPERIVFRHLSAEHPYEMTICLDEQGDGTRVTWRMRHATASECARVKPFVVEGNEQNFDRLASELARIARTGATSMDDQHRVQFDAEVTFQNGGRLAVEGFRLDIPGDDIGEADLAASFVRHLGLLMVGTVRITGKRVIREAHKGSRTVEGVPAVRQLVELSHPIRDRMVTYPGLPGPEISDHLTREASRARYAPGTEFHIARISMVANTGTYLDAPSHRFAEGADLAATPLQSVADLDGVVLRVAGDGVRAVDRELLLPLHVRGRAVLVHTGWDRHFGTDQYAKDAPFLTRRAAEWLAREGAALVGIDSINIDDMGDGTRPAHTVLLASGIPVVEHLRGLEQLPPAGFRFHAAPPRVQGMGTFPVRAYAVIEESAKRSGE